MAGVQFRCMQARKAMGQLIWDVVGVETGLRLQLVPAQECAERDEVPALILIQVLIGSVMVYSPGYDVSGPAEQRTISLRFFTVYDEK